MKRYLGSFMTAYLAIGLPLLYIIMPLAFGAIFLMHPIEPVSIVISIFCVLCVIVGIIYMRKVSRQLYSWGTFDEEGISIVSFLVGKTTILYKNCKSCGIGYYFHNAVGTSLGSRVCYIFFSYEPFDESYRTRMNMWKPSETRIKIEFNKKTYNYLLSVLPDAYVRVLQRDYDKYVAKRR